MATATKQKRPSNEDVVKGGVAQAADELRSLAAADDAKGIREWLDGLAQQNSTQSKYLWKPFKLELRKRLGIDYEAVSNRAWARFEEDRARAAAELATKAAAAPIVRLYTAGLVAENAEGETIAGWAICAEDPSIRAYGTINQERQKSFNPEDEHSADFVAAIKAVACAMDAVDYIGVDGALRAEILTSNPHLDAGSLVAFGTKNGVAVTVDVITEEDNPALAIIEEETGEKPTKELIPAELVVDEGGAEA
ncbi:hypothetical protein [Tsukamurella spumae]|uniref:Uncharacterized protein n=1 Tax=Tsukamurella spumae TaxID=44753 RepID=A0A846X2V0_9ACTN|nr:hypothetical protein [Tsukamurella spumae]NKY19483.1 hypothetical protein [Tsukamurella spumae]